MQNKILGIGQIVRLKRLNYEECSKYRDKIDEGVGFVSDMTHYNQKFKIISINPRDLKMTYKIKSEDSNYGFWVEDWQIASNKIKLEI